MKFKYFQNRVEPTLSNTESVKTINKKNTSRLMTRNVCPRFGNYWHNMDMFYLSLTAQSSEQSTMSTLRWQKYAQLLVLSLTDLTWLWLIKFPTYRWHRWQVDIEHIAKTRRRPRLRKKSERCDLWHHDVQKQILKTTLRYSTSDTTQKMKTPIWTTMTIIWLKPYVLVLGLADPTWKPLPYKHRETCTYSRENSRRC